MRTTKNSRLWAALVAATIAAPLTLSASVQPHGPRGSRGDRGGPGRIVRELDLSEEQREQMRELRERGSREAFERAGETRRALDEAVDSGADEGTIRQLAFQ